MQVPIYAAAQLTGAISASFTLTVLLHPMKNVGTTSPSKTEFQALIMEIVVTFSMMFVTSAVATDNKAVYITTTPTSYTLYAIIQPKKKLHILYSALKKKKALNMS